MPHEAALDQPGARAFSSTDLSVMAGLPFLALLARCVPAGHWHGICRTLSPLAISDLTSDPALVADVIRRTLGARLPDLSGQDILRGMAAEGILTFLQVLKKNQNRQWEPAITARHFERIAAAQKTGRGVILWVAHAFHGHLAAKIAFHRAGLAVTHLSHPAHGFSSSKFGMRYLNRLQTAVEDPYLAQRVLLPVEGQNKAIHTLSRCLRNNGVVSITGQRGSGRTVQVPFMSDAVKLAPGAPSLAHMTGATVLPVFAFRNERDEIEVTVEPALEIRVDAARDAAVTLAMHNYAGLLEGYVLRYPKQWLGWVQL